MQRQDNNAQKELEYMEQLHEFTREVNKLNRLAMRGASIRAIKNGLKKTVPMLEKLAE